MIGRCRYNSIEAQNIRISWSIVRPRNVYACRSYAGDADVPVVNFWNWKKKKRLLHTMMSNIRISKLRPQPFDIKIILSLRCNKWCNNGAISCRENVFQRYPSCLKPLYLSEAGCITIYLTLNLIYSLVKSLSQWKDENEDSLWERGRGNGLLVFVGYDVVASVILDSDTILDFGIFWESQKEWFIFCLNRCM